VFLIVICYIFVVKERGNPNDSWEHLIAEMSPSELEERRQRLFSAYIQFTQHTARKLNQPIRNVINEDFARALLPESLKDKDQPKAKEYCVVTPFGNLTLDVNRHTATSPFLAEDVTATLSKGECNILEAFVRQPRHVYTPDQLMEVMTDDPNDNILPKSRTYKNHLTRLRKKLDIRPTPGTNNHPLIRNIRGVGYVLLP